MYIWLLLINYSSAEGKANLKVDSLNVVARHYLDVSYPQATLLALQAINLSKASNYSKGFVIGTCTNSLVQANTNKCLPGLDALRMVAALARNLNDSSLSAMVHSASGVCWYSYGNYDSAIIYHNKALQYFPASQAIPRANEYLLLGKVFIKTGNSERALEYYQMAIPVFHHRNDIGGIARAQDLLGEIFYAQRLYEKALNTYDESYRAFLKFGSRSGQGTTMLHKGNAYYMQIKDDSAKACYEIALKCYTELGDSNGIAICYSNLSRIYLEAGKYDLATSYAHKALDAIRPGNYIAIEAGTYQQLGDIYGEVGKFDLAVMYVQKGLDAARASGNKVILKDCYKSLSELYDAMKKPGLALKSLLAAYRLKDSIQPVQFARQLAEMQARYETEKKDAKLKLLRQAGQITDLKLQKQNSELQKLRYLFILSLITIVIIVVAVYYYKSRRKLLEQIRREHAIREAEENERQRIAKDIHDELGSGLSKIRFLSELAGTHIEGRQQLQASLHSISDTSVGLIENMRDLIWAMNPENTTLDNLIARIREYSYDYLEDFQLTVSLDFPEDIPHRKISKETTRNVHMIVKELLQNVVKHAKAEKVFISVSINPRFRLEIKDNGIGYDGAMSTNGNGLKNIIARSQALGGTLKMTSYPGKGSCMILEFDIV
jgi:signal transduction histidine kinase